MGLQVSDPTFQPLSVETSFYEEVFGGDILLFNILSSVLKCRTIPGADVLHTDHPLLLQSVAFAKAMHSALCLTTDGNLDKVFTST